jgi:hypothetical protein
MLTKTPACRVVCKNTPGAIMDELVNALARLRNTGLTEAQALKLVAQAESVAKLFPEGSLGRMPSVAESFVDSGCATCAVNKAFSRR